MPLLHYARQIVTGLAITLSLCAHASRAAEPATSHAGWDEVDITPPLGIGLGGRGGR